MDRKGKELWTNVRDMIQKAIEKTEKHQSWKEHKEFLDLQYVVSWKNLKKQDM